MQKITAKKFQATRAEIATRFPQQSDFDGMAAGSLAADQAKPVIESDTQLCGARESNFIDGHFGVNHPAGKLSTVAGVAGGDRCLYLAFSVAQ